MDEHAQAGRRGLHHAAKKGLPVVIMEPLRGGKLVKNLPKSALEVFENHPIKHTPVQWALKWLWNQPEVTCVLSGMNTVDMVQDNLQTAMSSRPGDLTEADQAMLKQVVAAINANMKVGCTGCGYCMPCPKNVDIPGTFADYNRKYSEGRMSAFREHMMTTLFRKNQSCASNCVGCGKCEMHCPQHIAIRQELKNAKKELEGPLYRLIAFAVRKLKIFG
jgi:predicted aldo/keto reductase-like oxidoreductase